MGWIVAAIAGIIAGTAIEVAGNVQQAKSAAEARKLRAKQLEELSKPGGYYDQQLAALALEFKDIEEERAATSQLRAIDTLTLLEQGTEAQASIAAQAGVSGFAQEGSILTRGEKVSRAVQRGVSRIGLQYEDIQRGLESREAVTRARQTLTRYEKKWGPKEASLLRSEADWLNTWGVLLGTAGPIVGAGTQIIGLGF